MERTLKILFRRDASRDHQRGHIHYEGYQVLWPDGSQCAISLDAFCQRGQRLLGLDRSLRGHAERQIELIYFPLRGPEDSITRLPGHRVRRFYLQRQGELGRLHFWDGTPTDAAFDLSRDDPRILQWLGLEALVDGDREWLDLAARTVENVGRRESQGWLNGMAAPVDRELTARAQPIGAMSAEQQAVGDGC